MNEEEKEAIKDIEEMIELFEDDCLLTTEDDIKYLKVILNLIGNQQKEIEKLKDDLREERAFNKSALDTLKECVHKDKIKEKIKKCNSLLYSFEEEEKQLIARADIGSVNCLLSQIAILNSLLGE